MVRCLRELLKMELFDRLALSHKQAAVRTASNAVRNADTVRFGLETRETEF